METSGNRRPDGEIMLLEAESITKQYATVRAVDALSFSLEPGRIHALLGPNGAGKTSTVRMLIGLTKPDAGRITYHAASGISDHVSPRELGYLPEERGLYVDQPVLAQVLYLAGLRGMAGADARREAGRWLERFGLADRVKEKVSALSKGNQQKVQLITALIHRPRCLILDEPFSGFDPVNQELTLELLRELRTEGVGVLLSAHQMQLVERLADRIVLMNRGRQVMAGTMDELRREAGLEQRLTLAFTGPADEAGLARLPGVAATERLAGDRIALLLGEGADLNALLTAIGSGSRLASVQSEAIGLHEIYLRAVGGNAAAPTDNAVAI
jgi:ABC-2 type transport system ATP-binding protein